MTDTFSTANEVLHFLFGFVFIFIGDFIIGRLKTSKHASAFVRFLLATAFTYTAEVIKDIICFFIDFYKGTATQGYNLTPDDNILFFRIFGHGLGSADQFPLFFLNTGFFDMLIGCAVGGAVLFIVRTIIERKKAVGNE